MGVDCSLHILVNNFVGYGCLLLRIEQVQQFIDASLGSVSSLRGDHIITILSGGTNRLSAVLSQSGNISRIQCVGAGVNRIQIDIVIEQYIFHGKRLTIRELDTILKNEGISGGIAVFYDVVILDNNCFVIAVCNFDFTIDILGCQHADLSHGHDRAIRCRSGKERIEQTIQLVRHDNEGIHLLRSTATGKHTGHTEAHNNSQSKSYDSLFHYETPL